VLSRIADDDVHFQRILELDLLTNDRLQAENNQLLGIDSKELVFDIDYYHIINAAFTHPHPRGSRFNGPDRGAWYAGFKLKTAQEEVVWHKSFALGEITGWEEESATYDDYLADFGEGFHDIRDDENHIECLNPDSYTQSQALAENLLGSGASGIIYPSVRHDSGNCLACFRPAHVGNVRKHARYRFSWSEGVTKPKIELEETY
jgi:hypothetical protein